MRKIILSAIIMITIIMSAAASDFAGFLFKDGDYYRCVTELKREFYEGSPDSIALFNNIGVCYYMMEDYRNAELYFSRAMRHSDKAAGNYAITLFREKSFDELAALQAQTEKTEDICMLGKMMTGDFDKSRAVPEDSILKGIFEEYYTIKRKNPVLAGVMSIIPGLGRFYCERPDDALFAMSTVIIPVLAAVYYNYIDYKPGLYTAAGIAGLFALGDIYGAVNSANQYFPAKLKVFHEKIISDYSSTVFMLESDF